MDYDTNNYNVLNTYEFLAMNDQILQRIEKISIIKHNRDLFHALGGLDVELLRIDGTHLKSTASETSSPILPQEIIEQAYTTTEPIIFVHKDTLKRVIVPIVFNEELIGFLYTGETQDFQLDKIQLNAIAQVLSNFTQYVVKNELTPMDMQMHTNGTMTRQQELLNRAVKYIRQNYHSNSLTLRDVSLNNGISYHYLSRIFKKELDTTFAQFRSKVRMDAAKKMLKNRRLTISQVSYACGFDDPAYFCKVFKGSTGNSPSIFRNKVPSNRIHV